MYTLRVGQFFGRTFGRYYQSASCVTCRFRDNIFGKTGLHIVFSIYAVCYLFFNRSFLLNLVFIASASSIGLLISLTAKTRIMSIGLSFLIIMIFSPLGGLWFPLSTVPEILVNIAGILPSGAYMLAIEKIIIKQQSFYDIIPNIAVIMIFFIIALTSSMVIGIKRKKTLWI